MVLLSGGPSHTGKTLLAQKLLEKYGYPYLSLDHLKMGLIRSGQTHLTPEDDDELTDYLWPIAREIVKTAVENRQNLIVEGRYIPFDYKASFSSAYLKDIQYVCLIFSEKYLKENYASIRAWERVIEWRGEDAYPLETMLQDNSRALAACRAYANNYILIDGPYAADYSL